MDLNEKLFELRKKNNWSQEELAEKLDVSRQTVSKWESSKSIPELDKLVKLSEIYGISLDELIKDKFQEKEVFNKKKIRINWKKILIIIVILAFITWLLYYLNMRRRISIAKEISNIYNEDFESIGVTKGGIVYEDTINRDLNNIEEIHRRYLYSAENGEKRVYITVFEGENGVGPIEDIYIDLNNVNSDSTYNNVTIIDLNTNERKVVNDYSFESPIIKSTMCLNNYYGLIWEYKDGYDKELVKDFGNKLTRVISEDSKFYTWNNENMAGVNKSISFGMNNNNLLFIFDNCEDDIKEKREIARFRMESVFVPIENVRIPEE